MPVRRVGQRRIAGIAHDSQRVPACHALPGLDQKRRTVGKIQKVHGVGRLPAVQLNTDIIAPLPGLVAPVRDDTRPGHAARDALAFIVGHSDRRVVQPGQVKPAVPDLAPAAGPAPAGVGEAHLGAARKNSCLLHPQPPLRRV